MSSSCLDWSLLCCGPGWYHPWNGSFSLSGSRLHGWVLSSDWLRASIANASHAGLLWLSSLQLAHWVLPFRWLTLPGFQLCVLSSLSHQTKSEAWGVVAQSSCCLQCSPKLHWSPTMPGFVRNLAFLNYKPGTFFLYIYWLYYQHGSDFFP